MKKKVIKSVLLSVLIIFVSILAVMLVSVPSEEKLNNWIAETHGIDCDKYYNSCYKGNKNVEFIYSHQRTAMIFNSCEINFKYKNGKQVTFRILGIFGNHFEMNDGKLWEILN